MIRFRNYRLHWAFALVAATIPLCSHADATLPARLPPPVNAPGVHTYDYQADRIFTIRAGLGITTQIELSPNEQVLDYSTGFSSGWDLTRRDNVFYVKPKNVDVDTNMMIRTATHSYILELKVVATDWKTLDQARRAGVQYKVTFRYPSDTSFQAETKAVEKAPELDTSLVKGRDYHFDYDYAKKRRVAPWLVPTNVYDDGRFTYIRMPDLKHFPTGNFPTIYMREKGHGEDAIVNTTVEGNTIVVHGTYPYLVIRHDKNVIGLRRNAKK
ncbi:type IV secretion system protein VirB9 [Luteibacter sp. UNCMF331Sha3.1]|uniref:TrbG/VirB9 family P-type conjugative transfer protein n=1 Tax=Luteibacter sp. UNCMF331Sha3.1 TaxID=1502760 RepID=UPI0008B107F6|nr:TrbG/VirB9 family P-type conjugative transfer protein [Luteibacter sp. UNCMF331Sha3.1]SEM96429.1 type IV secretion system protein VirB9 [Luteibacter sp. UNCMF331Sha3.1]